MKSLKFSGKENWILVNPDTGEVGKPEEILEFTASDTDTSQKRSNFAILYPLKFYGLINAIGSKKMEVISYIIKNMGADNILIATSTEIAKKVQVSKNTVDRTLQALEKANLIHRRPGVIMLNPKLLNRKHRAGEYKLLLKYDNIGADNNGRQNAKSDDTPPQEPEQEI